MIQAADKVILRMAEQDVLNLNIVFKDNLNSFADFYVSVLFREMFLIMWVCAPLEITLI